MTPEEKAQQMRERNATLCAYYDGGASLAQTASRFKLGRQRTRQLLQAGGVWRAYVKKERTFLGVNVAENTKTALKEEADRRGVSVSKLADEMLDDALKEVR